MQIIREIQDHIAFSEEDLSYALQKINLNKNQIVFSVSEKGVLEGVMTDGDFLRYLLSGQKANLNVPLSRVANKTFLSMPIDSNPEEINKLFSDRVAFVPLLDDQQHLVAIASRHRRGFSIGDVTINKGSKVFVIAEIGINHNGNKDLAKKMIEEAHRVGADCAKFQMRDLDTLYRNHGIGDSSKEDLGAQYILDLLKRFQLSQADMFELFDYCKEVGIMPLCTPWDMMSLATLEEYGMPAYKVASADLTNHELLIAMAKTGKPMICSTGMSREQEIISAVKILNGHGASYCLLHCNSTYPAPFKDINLNYLDRLEKLGDCPVGYSGHERGYHVAVASVARGAVIIEKHFTLDRTMEGNDHKVSLLPDEFLTMVEGIRQVELSLGLADPRDPTQGELMNRENLSKSIVAKIKIAAGDRIERDMIEIKSPGRGLQPNRMDELLGEKAKRSFLPGDFFFEGDVIYDQSGPRKFFFKRPWGVPVRYHDVDTLGFQSNPDFLEFHFSYKDLDLDEKYFLKEPLDMGLVVHSPDLFKGDHLLNFASADHEHRKRSISELQKVIDVALRMKPFFKRCEIVPVVVSLGGFTRDKHLEKHEREALYEQVAEGLAQLNTEYIEILPQTLPPFPWYFGGQLFCNIFVEAEDTVAFCEKYGYRVCFDVSHSKLTCNHYNSSFNDFTKLVSPHTGHLHIVDAKGEDGEGIQIGEGEVDFALFSSTVNEIIPEVSFIPEIWQGHKNGGEGFWVALDRLEQWL